MPNAKTIFGPLGRLALLGLLYLGSLRGSKTGFLVSGRDSCDVNNPVILVYAYPVDATQRLFILVPPDEPNQNATKQGR